MSTDTSADHVIFISFSSADRDQAQRVCGDLERAGLRCWISLRDVAPGRNYQAEIVQAIQSAKAMVLVFSSHANGSDEVSKELSLASAFKCTVIPFRIEDVVPQGAFLYELATRQWIDGFANWDGALAQLLAAVRHAADGGAAPPAIPPAAAPALPVAISETVQEAARIALAPYIGPMARVMVRKAASEASSLDDFQERLAAHVPAAEDKAAFRRSLKSVAR